MPPSNTIEMRMVWRDQLGGIARPSAHLPRAIGLTAAFDAAVNLVGAISQISGASFASLSLTAKTIVSDDIPVGGQASNWRGLLIFDCEGADGQYLVLEIPGIKSSMVAESGVELDTDAQIIRDIIDTVVSRGYTNPAGYAAVALAAAIVRFEP